MSISASGYLGRTLTSISNFQYYSTATIVLFYYEYLITFGREVNLIWGRFSYISCLFLALRYTTFLGYIPTLYFEASPPNNSNACGAFAHFPGAMNSASLGLITIFLIWRTYALYHRSARILFATIPLGVINVILAAWSSTQVKTIFFTIGTGALHACVPEFLLSKTPYVASWAITISLDTLVSLLTISKTYRMHRDNCRVGLESRLTGMLLHDGSVYYVVMTFANVLNFVLFWVENLNYIEAGAGSSSEITHAISVIIVSRMILNIVEAGKPNRADPPDLTSIQITSHYSTRITGASHSLGHSSFATTQGGSI